MVAAPTTSLPERIGGTRNWDYRYCWLRDAALTLTVLHDAGYPQEALAWRDWQLRAVAADPRGLQIVYGPAGERHLPEQQATWLPGHHGSGPVRIGNAAAGQFQLDVYGEVADAQYSLVLGNGFAGGQQQVIRQVLAVLEQAWRQPDEGIWEIRGPRRHFTYSKVMAWAAFDRAVKLAGLTGLDGPHPRWRALRDENHAEVCRHGFDPDRNSFVQSYGSRELDASLLRLPAVGFLPATDPRVTATVAAIRDELSAGDGLILRYSPQAQGAVDGLHEREGAFLACSFWLADALSLTGRPDEARTLFERSLTRCNDVGLLAEQYDPHRGSLPATSRRPCPTWPWPAPRCCSRRSARCGPGMAAPPAISGPAGRPPGRGTCQACRRPRRNRPAGATRRYRPARRWPARNESCRDCCGAPG